jgi:hypothetical protein
MTPQNLLCEWCSSPFTSVQPKARFCCINCKKAAKHKRDRSDRKLASITKADAIRAAINSGKLPYAREVQCVFCKKQAAEWHHPTQYPLYVLPLCVNCHLAEHNQGKC